MNGSYPSLIEDLHVGSFSAVFRMHLGVNTVGVRGAAVGALVAGLVWHLLGDTEAEAGDEEEHPDGCHPDLCH